MTLKSSHPPNLERTKIVLLQKEIIKEFQDPLAGV